MWRIRNSTTNRSSTFVNDKQQSLIEEPLPRKTMKISVLAILQALIGTCGAFHAPHVSHRKSTLLHMANTLADKASAIRSAEARNQAEIEALKLQIAQIEDLFNRSPGSVAAATPSAFADGTRDQLGTRLSEFRQYLSNLVTQSKLNQQEYDQIISKQGGGPGLLEAIATSAAAGTFGGLVVGALDSNRRDSLGGILAGVAGSAASFASKSTESIPAPSPILDSRAPVSLPEH